MRRRALGRWALTTGGPLLLFLLLAALSARQVNPARDADWWQRAEVGARAVETRGAGLLETLGPREDPRVAPAILLLWAGLDAGAVPRVFQGLAVLVGAGAVLLLGRRAAREGRFWPASAWLLAASPVWTLGAAAADPGIVLGLLFLGLAAGAWPAVWGAVALGWALGWSPWAWVLLPLLLLGRGLCDGQRRRWAWSVLIPGLLLAALMAPPALREPGAWGRAILWEARLAGMGAGGGPFGVGGGGWAWGAALHAAGWLLLVLRAPSWPARVRAGDWAPLALLLAGALSLVGGGGREAPLLLLPWAAAEVGRRLGAPGPRVARLLRRPVAQVALAAVLILPLLGLQVGRLVRGVAETQQMEVAAADWLEAELPAGSLVAYDLGFAPPEESRLDYLPIPFHARQPEVHRGAYWTGWYQACRAVVVSERMLLRFLRAGRELPEAIAFYDALAGEGGAQRAFGATPGERIRVIRRDTVRADLGSGWERRVAQGAGAGLQGSFLARLGGALIRGGETGSGVALLEEALAAGYREAGLYLNLANGLQALERPYDAGRVLDEGLREHPQQVELLYSLGRVLVEVGFYDRATRTLARLREAWPGVAEVHYLLGVALVRNGQPAAGRRSFEEALELRPSAEQRAAIEQWLGELGGEP